MKRVTGFTVGVSVAVGLSLYCASICSAGSGTSEASIFAKSAPRTGLPASQLAKGFPHLQAFSDPEASQSTEEIIGKFAYKISYVGSLILTADRIVRSVDSVMESMELERPDGTCLRLCAEPGSRGFEVGLRLSRPFDF